MNVKVIIVENVFSRNRISVIPKIDETFEVMKEDKIGPESIEYLNNKKMRNKIKYVAILLLNLNLIMISCQSKSEKVDLTIVQESYANIVTGKQANQLRYRDYVDHLHSRIVLQGNQIQEKWQPFKNNSKLDYMDVYFNKEKIIGFKGFFAGSKNNSDEMYKDILKKISSDKEYQQIELKNEDSNIVRSEWESKEMIIGVKYEKVNKSIALTAVNKNEIPYFFDKIFIVSF